MVTPPAPAPTPPVSPPLPTVLARVITFLQSLLGSIDPTGIQTHTVLSYIVDVIGVLGTLVGVFNKQWGIDLGLIPQSLLIGVSMLIVLGINAYRLWCNKQISLARHIAFEHAIYIAAQAYGLMPAVELRHLGVLSIDELAERLAAQASKQGAVSQT